MIGTKGAGVFSLPLIFCLLTCPLSGVYASSGTEGAAFLDIPVGAAPAAMGSAYSALATDAYSPVWNPAGLGFLSGPELAGQHLSYLESINYEFAAFAMPLRKDPDSASALGVSMQYLGSGDIAGTAPSGDPIGDYSSHYAAYSAAYGQKLNGKLSLGVTGKIIEAKIAEVSAHAFAGDAGILYRADHTLQLAATIVNAGSQLTFSDSGDPLPLAFHAAAAYRPDTHLTLLLEGVYSRSGPLSARTGIEWKPLEMLSLRAGYKTDTLKELSALAGFTTGLGITVWGQEFSYAWLPYGDLGNTQYFSVLAKFGAAEQADRNLIQYQNIKTHRAVNTPEETSPDYPQLMELLNDTEQHLMKQRAQKGAAQ